MKPKKPISRATAMRRADRAFSLFIRTRDSQKFFGKQFQCISCGRILPIEQCDAGHYVNRQHQSLRYNEFNVNGQCRHCNRFDEGNMQGYRQGLVEKHGELTVKQLEGSKRISVKRTTGDFLLIERVYKDLTKAFTYQIR